MKRRHNKKRNTALVYEALIKEATAAILRGDHSTKEKVVSIVKKHFGFNSVLRKDLQCYQSLAENQSLSTEDSRRILNETKMQKRLIDPTALFKAQSEAIKDVNIQIDSDIFNNFVPNYKTLATIDQMFSLKTSPKDKVLLENEIVTFMSDEIQEIETQTVDDLVITTFVEKFNKKYSNNLLEEQRELLTHYILSFSDNAVSLKMFLNNEISRLKEALSSGIMTDEIKSDKDMADKTTRVVEKLKSYSGSNVSDDLLFSILKTQELVKEISDNGSND
tara:strand:+ start:503 stop:1333 length:831 start_codon:yes stop_codon:yes gene_type:complete